MQPKFMRSVAMLTLVLLSQLAQAFVDPPTLSPANPMEGQTISVNIRVGQCDALPVGYEQITQTGNAIHLLLNSYHASDLEFCNIAIGTPNFPLGAYSAGAYTLQVDRTYAVRDGNVVETLGTLPLTVAAAPAPAVLATNGLIGLFALFATLLLIAVPVLLRRQLYRNTSNP